MQNVDESVDYAAERTSPVKLPNTGTGLCKMLTRAYTALLNEPAEQGY